MGSGGYKRIWLVKLISLYVALCKGVRDRAVSLDRASLGSDRQQYRLQVNCLWLEKKKE